MKRFPNEYKSFLAKKEDDLIGTPIESLKGITPSVVSELRSLQVRTVEDLADLSDNVTIMGLQEWKRKAGIFLEKNSVAAAQKKEADLMARIAELEARVAAPAAKAKKGSDSEE
jgi:predicted RecB family nuclease